MVTANGTATIVAERVRDPRSRVLHVPGLSSVPACLRYADAPGDGWQNVLVTAPDPAGPEVSPCELASLEGLLLGLLPFKSCVSPRPWVWPDRIRIDYESLNRGSMEGQVSRALDLIGSHLGWATWPEVTQATQPVAAQSPLIVVAHWDGSYQRTYLVNQTFTGVDYYAHSGRVRVVTSDVSAEDAEVQATFSRFGSLPNLGNWLSVDLDEVTVRPTGTGGWDETHPLVIRHLCELLGWPTDVPVRHTNMPVYTPED